MKVFCFLLVCVAAVARQQPVPSPQPAAAPQAGERFEISTGEGRTRIYGRGSEVPRVYFQEFLPALFTRTLALNTSLPAGAYLDWIFTGDQGGVTIRIDAGAVHLTQRHYDSIGLSDTHPPAKRFPERVWEKADIPFKGVLRTVTLSLDSKLGLDLYLNDQHVLRQVCLLDVRRHQLQFKPASESDPIQIQGLLLNPSPKLVEVRVDEQRRYQTIYGFGGILSGPAYALLSPAGRRQWWNLIRDYNLLLDREYPNGNRLLPDLSNFGDLKFATPHYYSDNFPNSEITDFDYVRRIRSLGGHVLFEFWELPPWARRPYHGTDKKIESTAIVDEYVRAMVGFCKILREKTGAPPEIVGVQNEITQPAEVWQRMIIALRKGLNVAGFQSTRIHMPDAGQLTGGIRTTAAIRASAEAWASIDYSATHLYDFQKYFQDQDGYDTQITEWNRATNPKPFLSTELAVNDNRYQTNSYRIAFAQAQLYHKIMGLMNASALIYCWSLLDVEQPSFAATRSLFTVDRANGFVPAPSGYQLRTYGAFSRWLREGMVRVQADSPSADLLTTAYVGRGGSRTMILINRSLAPMSVRVQWPGGEFNQAEITSPYAPNTPLEHLPSQVTLEPGEILTLSNVPRAS